MAWWQRVVPAEGLHPKAGFTFWEGPGDAGMWLLGGQDWSSEHYLPQLSLGFPLAKGKLRSHNANHSAGRVKIVCSLRSLLMAVTLI